MKFQVLLIAILVSFVGLVSAEAQGGKAEPKRIQFAAGKTSATLRATLSNAQEMEYVFYARGGQTVTITNVTTSLFDFKVYSEDYFDEGDYDSSRSYSFVVPETGDYLLFVRKKQVLRPRTARFSVTITIR